MRIRSNGAVAPISHGRVSAHQHRELRNLGLLANPAACNANVSRAMENLLEYALAARTEHRSDGAQEHKMEILLDYDVAASTPLSENHSDVEVVESSQAAN